MDKNITSDGTNIDFGMWQNGDGFDDGFLFIEQMGPDFFRWVTKICTTRNEKKLFLSNEL